MNEWWVKEGLLRAAANPRVCPETMMNHLNENPRALRRFMFLMAVVGLMLVGGGGGNWRTGKRGQF